MFNEGILDNAQLAVNKYKEASINEQEILNSIDKYISDEIGDETDVTEPEDPVNPDDIEVGDIVTAGDIANLEDKTDIYGATVNGYDCENNRGVRSWRILYVDSNNIYLIASNYINIQYCPNGKNGTAIDGYDNNLYMENVIKDYSGSSDIIDERIKKLNEDYFINNQYNSSNISMKSVAYMLDISENVWGKFAGEKAEYAIGGPTIELLFKSYNEKYKTNNKYQAKTQNRNGYLISSDGGKSYYYEVKNNKDFFNISDELYLGDDSFNNPYAMWIATPSAMFNDYICDLNYEGNIETISYDFYSVGFRPVVCLKSDVKLEKLENGNFLIK